ncbi:MAG: sulfotransferase family protein [Saprospiraceae bacterium]|nr:sulfotransferase family protein [Saprospiraceae bacterium]
MNYRSQNNILIQEYKSIFIILPKNACSSIKSHIIKLLGFEKGPNYPIDVHDPKIYPYPFVKKEELQNEYSDYLRFCISRNPWDRLVSCYKDKIRAADYQAEGYTNGVAIPLLNNSSRFFGGMSFKQFVEVVATIPDSEAEHHFTSQLYQITDSFGQLLVNYIGRLETLKNDLDSISCQSGIPISQFPHIRKTKASTYQEYYTDELIEKVRKRYSADINFFNYKFDQKTQGPSFGFVSDNLQSTLYECEGISDILREKNKALYLQLHRLSTQVTALKKELKREKIKLNGLHNSISWKITTPLRSATTAIQSIFTRKD